MDKNVEILNNMILDFQLSEISDVDNLISTYRDNFPVIRSDLIFSVVFVDLTRNPIALLKKCRSNNFSGFKDKYHNELISNLQFISDSSFIHELIYDQSLIVIEDVNELIDSEYGDYLEREFMLKNDWKSAIFHTLFHENINYGFLAIYTLQNRLLEPEIDQILEITSLTIPYLSDKLISMAYKWKSDLYKEDIKEIEKNLSDLILAVDGRGIIVRINQMSSYYLGSTPEHILGRKLNDISPKLYQGIIQAIDVEKKKSPLVEVELDHPSGQPVVLELDVWKTNMASDDTLICFASDITLLKIFQREMSKEHEYIGF